MSKQTTAFILGAGAGADIGMPLGARLSTDIRIRCFVERQPDRIRVGDQHLYDALGYMLGDGGQYVPLAQTLARGLVLAPSIDEYLHAHRANLKLQGLGKLAIARSILEFEKKTKLYAASHLDPDLQVVSDSWLPQLFRFLVRRIERGAEAGMFEDIFIVNFNYDRCIEQFLFHAVKDYFDLQREDANKVLSELKIVHPYGTVGKLPWQADRDFIPFGADLLVDRLQDAAKPLRTFNEETAEDHIAKIRGLVERAERLVFLGFHFHPQNLELLLGKPKAKYIYATVMDRSAEDKLVIRQMLRKFLDSNHGNQENAVRFVDGTCVAAFTQYGLLWSSQLMGG